LLVAVFCGDDVGDDAHWGGKETGQHPRHADQNTSSTTWRAVTECYL
jgi:hypothetical protein